MPKLHKKVVIDLRDKKISNKEKIVHEAVHEAIMESLLVEPLIVTIEYDISVEYGEANKLIGRTVTYS